MGWGQQRGGGGLWGNSAGGSRVGAGRLQPLRTTLHNISISPKQFELKQS